MSLRALGHHYSDSQYFYLSAFMVILNICNCIQYKKPNDFSICECRYGIDSSLFFMRNDNGYLANNVARLLICKSFQYSIS